MATRILYGGGYQSGKLSYAREVMWDKLTSAPIGYTMAIATPKGVSVWKRIPVKKERVKIKIKSAD